MDGVELFVIITRMLAIGITVVIVALKLSKATKKREARRRGGGDPAGAISESTPLPGARPPVSMAMVHCPECGARILPTAANGCPNCGTQLQGHDNE